MNKTELAAAVAETTGTSKAAAAEAVTAVLNAIQAAVARGENVQLIGFGTFERRFREGGEMRTPQGGTVHVADKHAPTFKAGATFKDLVNEGGKNALVSA